MGLPTIRRRIGKLEIEFAPDRFAGYPPLTAEEIETLAGRMVKGEKWTDEETGRVARQCPIIQGELLITAERDGVFMKRYPGIDLAEI
jgi:hypothetical protein